MDKPRDLSQFLGKNSRMKMDLKSTLEKCKKNDYYINMWSPDQLNKAIENEKKVRKLDPLCWSQKLNQTIFMRGRRRRLIIKKHSIQFYL